MLGYKRVSYLNEDDLELTMDLSAISIYGYPDGQKDCETVYLPREIAVDMAKEILSYYKEEIQ